MRAVATAARRNSLAKKSKRARGRRKIPHLTLFRRAPITSMAFWTRLDDAFGQRIVSTMFTMLNQYHVVLQVSPSFSSAPKR